MWITRLCFVIILNVVLISAKKYDRRCKLVRDLIRSGMPNDIFLGQWVCLIEKVSKRDTAAFTVTPSGKKAYGLYQIPSRWCRERKKGGDCNIACESLLDDDIRDDTICAELIFQREGFKYWSLWTTRCKDDRMIVTEIYKELLRPHLVIHRNAVVLSHCCVPMEWVWVLVKLQVHETLHLLLYVMGAMRYDLSFLILQYERTGVVSLPIRCPDLAPRSPFPEKIKHSDILRYRRMLGTRYIRNAARV